MRISRTLNRVLLAGSACVAVFAAAPIAWSASLTLTTNASPNFSLSPSSAPLIDLATLSGGVDPTGTVEFTLTGPGGFSFSQTDVATGNGLYSAETILPTTGSVIGTYSWNVSYSGDGNNNAATAPTENTVVSVASPSLSTTASSGGLPGSTLTDVAQLLGGYFPTGTIIFSLTGPGGATVDTETVVADGNGTYMTPIGFTLPTTGTVAGTYVWDVLYSGDGNNNAAPASLETVTVGGATPLPAALPLFATDSAD